MKLLLDTQIVLWTIAWPERLPEKARLLIADDENEKYFSPVSIWEVAIKAGKNSPEFQVNAKRLRRRLLDKGCLELPITGLHASAISDLPSLHKDPFDRLLLAQAKMEEITLLTSDAVIGRYPGRIICVK